MFITFDRFTKLCANWHIQCDVEIILRRNGGSIYSGQFCDMPIIISKVYVITKFYVANVSNNTILIEVAKKSEIHNECIKRG